MSLGDIRIYRDPDGLIDGPTGIIGSPDGDIWFTSIGNGRVGRVRAHDNRVETFADPNGAVKLPANIFPAADGRMWFTCLGSNRLGAIDPASPEPASTIRTYGHPDLDKPVALKAATDGRLWFSLRGSNAIGCLDPKSDDPPATIRTFRADTMASPAALIPGSEGRIWWVNAANDTIGCLDPDVDDPSETIGVFGSARELSGPRAWAIDRTHRLWLTTQGSPGLVSFEPSAPQPGSTVRRLTHPRLRAPDGIWLGTDDALWLADTGANAVVRFDPRASAWTFFGEPPLVDGPFDIKSGANPNDGFLWFTNKRGNSIGRISSDAAP
jgi:virginiamycin B lyase